MQAEFLLSFFFFFHGSNHFARLLGRQVDSANQNTDQILGHQYECQL